MALLQMSDGSPNSSEKTVFAKGAALCERIALMNLNRLWSLATPTMETKRTLSEYCRKLVDAMDNAGTEKRQQVLRLLISEIAFEGVQVRIRGAITTDQNLFNPQPIDSWAQPSGVGIIAPTSRSLERNPDKMEFEIVAPVKTAYFKESRKAA